MTDLIEIEREGWGCWRVWASPESGHPTDVTRFTRKGALRAGRRHIKRQARRSASFEELSLLGLADD